MTRAGGGCNEAENISVPGDRASEFPICVPMSNTRIFAGTGIFKLQVPHRGAEVVFLN